jgi:hypothetical protein
MAFRGPFCLRGTRPMTEADWLSWNQLNELLKYLFGKNLSERKGRLFACACCRRIWDLLPRVGRYVIHNTERWADGLLSAAEIGTLRQIAEGLIARWRWTRPARSTRRSWPWRCWRTNIRDTARRLASIGTSRPGPCWRSATRGEQVRTDRCRGPGSHVRGCWLVNQLLGKE